LHASDLPEGKGWSPHVWNILEGKNILTVSLLNAASKVDAGDIWLKTRVALNGHELFDEINHKLFIAELELMSKAIDCFNEISPKSQVKIQSNYYPKRTPEDSRLDPNKTFLQQFNLLRIADEVRYPAFFEHLGCKYIVTIKKG
jgi:methionyl-tRNA formyltransferase